MCVSGFGQETGEGAAGKVSEYIYKKTPQGELKLYIHFPRDWKKGDKRPGIIFFFGGAWVKGSPTQFIPQAEYFAGRGMVTARADYRLGISPVVCVEDAKSAVRWFRAHAGELGLDPDRIVGSGGSAGGHIAACAAMTDTQNAKGEDLTISSKPNVMVLFNPVVIIEERIAEKVKAVSADEAKQISPILHMKKDTPPAILFYGTKDQFLAQGRAFLAKSKDMGNRVEVYSAAEQPHGFFNRSPWTEVTMRQADEFLVSLGYLKGEPTVKIPGGAPASLKKEP
jgi:acetyl esterase/lipase